MMLKNEELIAVTVDRQFLSFMGSRNRGSLWFLRTAYGNYKKKSFTKEIRIIQKYEKKEEVPKKILRNKECRYCYRGITNTGTNTMKMCVTDQRKEEE